MKKLLNLLNKEVIDTTVITVAIFIGICFGAMIGNMLVSKTIEHHYHEHTKQTDTIRWVNLSSYQAVESQCDKDPLLTGSGYRVLPSDTYKTGDSIAYIACSQDLMQWRFNYYDTVRIISYDSIINIKAVVVDVMNRRLVHSIDLLTELDINKKVRIVF